MGTRRGPRPGFQVDRSRTTRTHWYCWAVAKEALEQARAAKPPMIPSMLQLMTAGVFAAFHVEGFMNHLGELRVPDWDKFDLAAPHEKLRRLQEVLKFDASMSKRPFSTFSILFRLRNEIAHGRTVTLRTSDKVFRKDDVPKKTDLQLIPYWKRMCTLETIERLVEDAKGIVQALSKADPVYGHLIDPHSPISVGRSTVSRIDEEE